MPAPPNTSAEFLDVLQNSQLLKDSVMAKVRDQVPALCAGPISPERLAKSLVISNLITMTQAQRLLNGHCDGFYIGKYKLLDLLGRGGMGKVFLAEHITMNRLVALKVIARLAKNREDTLSRFRREARAVASLSHPNIIQAYDYDEIDGLPYISMEFVEGLDLGDQLELFGRLPWSQVADYGMQAALGLECARKAGFVHRDIKPGNLLTDREGIVKVLDLGLAVSRDERINDSVTCCNDQIGTVDYMSPEQAIDSHRVDIRSDIYSLGGLLYFAMTGQLPCPGNSSAEKLLRHQQTPPPPLCVLIPHVPEGLTSVIHKMLEKKREARYQTPAEVAEALRPFAQRRVPPFDLASIKHTRESLAPLLDRSPGLSSINLRSQMSGITSPLRNDPAPLPPTVAITVPADAEIPLRLAASPNVPTTIIANASASTIATGEKLREPAAAEIVAAPPNSNALPVLSLKNGPTPDKHESQSLAMSNAGQKPIPVSKRTFTERLAPVEEDFVAVLPAPPPVLRAFKKKVTRKATQQDRSAAPIYIGIAACLSAVIATGLLLWLG